MNKKKQRQIRNNIKKCSFQRIKITKKKIHKILKYPQKLTNKHIYKLDENKQNINNLPAIKKTPPPRVKIKLRKEKSEENKLIKTLLLLKINNCKAI